MKVYKPLYETLEFRVTTNRVCRSLGFILQKPEYKILNNQIRALYKELTDQDPIVTKSLNPELSHINYPVYPAEFIPVMINIAKDFKPKEPE